MKQADLIPLIKEYIEANKRTTIPSTDEMAQKFGVYKSQIWYALRELGYETEVIEGRKTRRWIYRHKEGQGE
jgi:hypothetical protein